MVYLIEGINPKSWHYYGHLQLGCVDLSKCGKGLIWTEHEFTECNIWTLTQYMKNKKDWKVTLIGEL